MKYYCQRTLTKSPASGQVQLWRYRTPRTFSGGIRRCPGRPQAAHTASPCSRQTCCTDIRIHSPCIQHGMVRNEKIGVLRLDLKNRSHALRNKSLRSEHGIENSRPESGSRNSTKATPLPEQNTTRAPSIVPMRIFFAGGSPPGVLASRSNCSHDHRGLLQPRGRNVVAPPHRAGLCRRSCALQCEWVFELNSAIS
jgi:hypothetical protein